jgi:hypothetical protein
MANYLCSCRSSYFKVKDADKFLAWATGISEISARIETEGKHKGLAVILGNDPDGGGWPSQRFNEEKDEFEEYDFFAELSQHLAKGWSVILMEAGAERLRYIVAQAVVVDWRGKIKVIDAGDEARKVVKRWKVKVGDGEY